MIYVCIIFVDGAAVRHFHRFIVVLLNAMLTLGAGTAMPSIRDMLHIDLIRFRPCYAVALLAREI